MLAAGERCGLRRAKGRENGGRGRACPHQGLNLFQASLAGLLELVDAPHECRGRLGQFHGVPLRGRRVQLGEVANQRGEGYIRGVSLGQFLTTCHDAVARAFGNLVRRTLCPQRREVFARPRTLLADILDHLQKFAGGHNERSRLQVGRRRKQRCKPRWTMDNTASDASPRANLAQPPAMHSNCCSAELA